MKKRAIPAQVEPVVMTFDSVIQKYFGSDKTKYFQSSDALTQIEGDTALRYQRRSDGRVELYFIGDGGEICLRVCSQPEELNELVKRIIY